MQPVDYSAMAAIKTALGPTPSVSTIQTLNDLCSGIISKETLDATRPFVAKVREEAAANKRYGFSDPFGIFLRKMYFLNPQGYGARVQNYFSEKFGFKTVPAKANKGDFKDANENHFEFKFSFADGATPCLNLVQIRLFQEIEGYYCVASDVKELFKTYVFQLSKEQMTAECSDMNASSAHGTKEALVNNSTRELRLTIPINGTNEHFERWRRLYADPSKEAALNREL